jgi:Ankyrin repeats (3 copies)
MPGLTQWVRSCLSSPVNDDDDHSQKNDEQALQQFVVRHEWVSTPLKEATDHTTSTTGPSTSSASGSSPVPLGKQTRTLLRSTSIESIASGPPGSGAAYPPFVVRQEWISITPAGSSCDSNHHAASVDSHRPRRSRRRSPVDESTWRDLLQAAASSSLSEQHPLEETSVSQEESRGAVVQTAAAATLDDNHAWQQAMDWTEPEYRIEECQDPIPIVPFHSLFARLHRREDDEHSADNDIDSLGDVGLLIDRSQLFYGQPVEQPSVASAAASEEQDIASLGSKSSSSTSWSSPSPYEESERHTERGVILAHRPFSAPPPFTGGAASYHHVTPSSSHHSRAWPSAVPEEIVCNNDSDNSLDDDDPLDPTVHYHLGQAKFLQKRPHLAQAAQEFYLVISQVALDDDDDDDEQINAACQMIGRHAELCQIRYPLSDEMKMFLQARKAQFASPDDDDNAVAVQDHHQNALPLALLCARPSPPLALLEAVYLAFPEAIGREDQVGTPLHYACCFHAQEPVLSFLLHRYVDAVRITNHQHCTPLHLACQRPDVQAAALALLLNPFATAAGLADGHGYTPLHHACLVGAPPEVLGRLVGGAAVSSSTAWRMTSRRLEKPLHLVCRAARASYDTVAWLIAQDPSAVSATDQAFGTPLWYAVQAAAATADCAYDNSEWERVIRLLIRIHPEALLLANEHDERPLDVARRLNLPRLVELLQTAESRI